MATTFERKVLSFDEIGFEGERMQIQKYCNAANEAIAELNDDFGLPLTDEEKKAIFSDLNANPNGFLDNHYKDQKSKILRNEATENLKESVKDMVHHFGQFDQQSRKTIQLKRGKFCIDEILLEDVKRKFEYSLNSERAIALYEKHNEIFSNMQEILKEIKQNGNSFNWRGLFSEDHKDNFNLKMNHLNYNIL